ncbi:hypothetical protein N7468_008766 [Penicillium chermesinum]|uniref:Uncharacterized protein n=1 Tax=Penicillium chermesinum TaxID=63820 RepID=A0A9W9NGM9_9EURO|nr:uncharacterized protein N7468_008766 [Penicillium chermesinum]KAJ5219562.1 hypothetical protein N7468_008766 [Penicillium chermesinum]
MLGDRTWNVRDTLSTSQRFVDHRVHSTVITNMTWTVINSSLRLAPRKYINGVANFSWWWSIHYDFTALSSGLPLAMRDT